VSCRDNAQRTRARAKAVTSYFYGIIPFGLASRLNSTEDRGADSETYFDRYRAFQRFIERPRDGRRDQSCEDVFWAAFADS